MFAEGKGTAVFYQWILSIGGGFSFVTAAVLFFAGRRRHMGIFSVAADYFQRGGLCMWPLLLCSLAVVFIGVERYLYYRGDVSDTKFILAFCRLLNESKLDEAQALAESSKGSAARIAAAMLPEKNHLGTRFASVVYARVDRAINEMHRYMNFLSVVIGLSPMLGLLGTITGMMASFNALNERLENPIGVTAGIGEALITTVFGLCIAIVGMCIHAYLSARIKGATLDMEEMAGAMIDEAEAEKGRV